MSNDAQITLEVTTTTPRDSDSGSVTGRALRSSPTSSSETPTSPFRGSRFELRTRREAMERRFGGTKFRKSPPAADAATDDEKKVEDLHPSRSGGRPGDDATPLVSNRSLMGSHRDPRQRIFRKEELRRGALPLCDTKDGETDSATATTDVSKGPQHLEEEDSVYYKVVYRGVVSLLSSPEAQAPRSGSYLSYGEIFQSHWRQDVDVKQNKSNLSLTPRATGSSSAKGGSPWSGSLVRSTEPPSLPPLPSSSSGESDHSLLRIRFVRVDKVITGGYSVDSGMNNLRIQDESRTEEATKSERDVAVESKSKGNEPGFLLSHHGEDAIVEQLSNAPRVEEGSFFYKVISTSPLPILSGPSHDAPRTRAVVLPGTIHEVSLRISMDDPKQDSSVQFLRLSHRRGWIADGFLPGTMRGALPTLVVKEVEPDGSRTQDCDVSILSGGSTLSSVTVPTAASRRRHRAPRRRTDAKHDSHAKTHVSVNNVFFPATTPTKTSSSITHESYQSKKLMSPSSNISILSDDDSSLDQTASARDTHPTSPDMSFSTAKSAGSTSSVPCVFYLMRATAPRGLKVLDAPHFQVNNLIHGNTGKPSVSSSHMVSQLESNIGPPKSHHSIFQTMSGRLTTTGPSRTGNPAVFDASSRTRILPRGVLFEASRRMESSGAFNQGAGLIKLSDNSGWAIVPRKDELDSQYRNFHALAGVKEGEAMRAYEEVGHANLDSVNSEISVPGRSVWIRVHSRPGVVVACPPPVSALNDGDTSPTSSRASSTVSGSNAGSNVGLFSGQDSDVASSVGSGFLDAMFRTPKKKKPRDGEEHVNEAAAATTTAPRGPLHSEKHPTSDSIPCGMCVEVERWGDLSLGELFPQEYVRLRGGQGWVPMVMGEKIVSVEIQKPEFRFGSFWFRVQSSRGIKARLGPSRKAPSIKSEDGVYFRFECGEFLRASEVVTIFSDSGEPSESFAKLYRNRHVQLHRGHEDFRQLSSLTTPAEWVQIYGHDDLYLEECSEEPRIERHRQGWRYNVVPESGIVVRKGPSFAAETTGATLYGGESVVVNERVSPGGEKLAWLRLKDGQGWVHDIEDDGTQIMIAHSLRHRANLLARPRKSRPASCTSDGEKEIAYNTIVARLFHNDTPTAGGRQDTFQQLSSKHSCG